jgi:hypothetical protein
LVGVLNRVQCEVLIDFQAFLALMARDELDLHIRQTMRGQPGDHLVAEEMRVHRLGNAGAAAVTLHELLDAARCEAGVSLRLEHVAVQRVSLQVAFQDQPEVGLNLDTVCSCQEGFAD